MKILQISTTDAQGGAARACYRLARGLRNVGENCELLVRFKTTDDDFIHAISGRAAERAKNSRFPFSGVIQEYYINQHRTEMSNTIFSLSCTGRDITDMTVVQDADIINLHWIVDFQSPASINKILTLKKPVVWTMHDQWPFTGGCHYTAGCDKFRMDCFRCPQLAEDKFELAAAILKDKLDYFKGTSLTIVSPSRWLAECAKESTVFRSQRIETIPNSLETDVFFPVPKTTARNNLGLKTDGLVLLFASENGNEKRKGFYELLLALRSCMASKAFSQLVHDKKISVLCFGHPARELAATGIHVVPLGYLTHDEQIRDAYSAADIFILPSLEDNLPNTMLESMSCGTPVIAFNIGGMPDVIINELTGIIVPFGDTNALGNAILSLTFDQERREQIGRNCRKLMVERYSLAAQARSYMQLYRDIQKDRMNSRPRSVNLSDKAVRSDTVHIDTTLGPHLNKIYVQILFMSLVRSIGPKIMRVLRKVKIILRSMHT